MSWACGNRADGRRFSPADRPSPLLALYDETLKRYYYPQHAEYERGRYRLSTPTGRSLRCGSRGEAALH